MLSIRDLKNIGIAGIEKQRGKDRNEAIEMAEL